MFFYSWNMKYIRGEKTNGYYHAQICSAMASRFFNSNNERAFVGVQIQQLLTARSVLEDPLYVKSLAHHIDLLAFSISEEGIQLLAYCIDSTSLQQFIDIIIGRLGQYRSEYRTTSRYFGSNTSVTVRKLAGEHEALMVSVDIHLLHKDWEYDRYSSIGFYLHDRRGDWMRLWRLAKLFDNDASAYRTFIERSQLKHRQFDSTDLEPA
jgi:hypothetical protein